MLNHRITLAGLIAGAAVAAAASAVAAPPAPAYGPPLPGADCFRSRDWGGWSSPDDRTVYLDVRGDFYRVEVLPAGSKLDRPGKVLINRERGSGQVCSARDLDLRVVDRISGFDEPLFPIAIAKLTPEEAQAIPQKERPGIPRTR